MTDDSHIILECTFKIIQCECTGRRFMFCQHKLADILARNIAEYDCHTTWEM